MSAYDRIASSSKRVNISGPESSSKRAKISGPEMCQSCGFTLDHPCEIFQITDCPRCIDDIYDCGKCEGTGKNLEKLTPDGRYPLCKPCQGCGKRRDCKWCDGKGQLLALGTAHSFPCEECEGQGRRFCEICRDGRVVKKFLGLCPGDYFCGQPRPHRMINKHPGKNAEAREEWGEVIRPYEPTRR